MTETFATLLEHNFGGDLCSFKAFALDFLEKQEQMPQRTPVRSSTMIGNREMSPQQGNRRKRANRLTSVHPPTGIAKHSNII